MREGRTLDLENKAFAKRSHFIKANVQRRIYENNGYPLKLVRGECRICFSNNRLSGWLAGSGLYVHYI